MATQKLTERERERERERIYLCMYNHDIENNIYRRLNNVMKFIELAKWKYISKHERVGSEYE